MGQPYLSVQGYAVGYHGRAVLNGVTLSVARGQIVTVIGPNGAGKSTLLKTLARRLAPLGGTAFLDGRDLAALPGPEAARKMAVMLTDRAAPDLMTCSEVVAAGRYPYTGALGLLSAADRAAVAQALALVHAEELADRPFARVSDGQRQRVLLARAVCQQPELIVLDEPTSFLDVRHKLELLTILKSLVREQNLAVLLTLHELDLAQKISDLVVCVKDGKIESAGTPEEIFTAAHVRALFGVTAGSYNAAFGSVELPAPSGAPQAFVIGGGGAGIPVYRALQRQGVPFAAGILSAADLDWPVAAALAARVVEAPPYAPAPPEAVAAARAVMARCPRVLCPLAVFGPMNEANRLLREEAAAAGKLEGGAPDGV